MNKLKLFILATSIVAFLSCSSNHTPVLDDDATFDGNTRSDNTQNDTTKNNGTGTDISDWENGGVEDITANEVKQK